ncbi:MAG: aspartate kinase, monofunctional class [Anaerolineae bacterium]
MTTLTMKFGGTSVGSVQAIEQAADIVLEQAQKWERLVVVVSAMSGVTNALTQGALTAASGGPSTGSGPGGPSTGSGPGGPSTGSGPGGQTQRSTVADLRVRHYRVVDELLNGERAQLLAAVDEYLDEFDAFCRSIYVLGEVTPRAMDAITSLGERINARILAALLRQRGARSEAIDATELIITDETFQDAMPLMDATRARVSARLNPLLDEGVIPIVTGFMGATENGVTTTLGRGGSDYSAAILGDCLDADEVWIWTDVDGVMTADPRIVPDARIIPILSYGEVGEMAYFGAKVLHPRTIRPVVERGIPLWVKNTFNPTCPGTCIVCEPQNTPGAVKAVTAIKGLSMVTVEGRGMMGVPGIAARTFAAVASQGASVLMISQASSEQSICFVIPTEVAPAVIHAVEAEMALELARRDVDQIRSQDDVVIVTAVGAGLRETPGVAARIFGALGKGDINVTAIAQGSSDCSISLVVAADDAAEAVRQVHTQVVINGDGQAPVPEAKRSEKPAPNDTQGENK